MKTHAKVAPFLWWALLAPACKNTLNSSDDRPAPQTQDGSNPSPANNIPGSHNGLPNSNPPPNPGTGGPTSPENARAAVRVICSTAPGSAQRASALEVLDSYQPGSQPWNNNQGESSPEACIDALRLSAVFTNLISGVPAGTLLGQAVQETGFCKSTLSKDAMNYHGMKANVPVSAFTYWKGEKVSKASTESTTGEGNLQTSEFMKFSHPDFSFYSHAERLVLPTLPYRPCLSSRDQVESFMTCIGSHWAVHSAYAQVVLGHREKYKLAACELVKTEWKLRDKWKAL